VKVDVAVSSTPSRTARAQQLSAAFDVPLRERETLTWHGEMPIEERPWNVGLIVGPSGSGKSTILRELFGAPLDLRWDGDAVVDDFPRELSIEDVTQVCGAVGFNTIPAWLRRYAVLSTGEQFRVSLARTLVESATDRPMVVDEFTSVVDRQVAAIGAHAAQKWARRHERQLVVATCHYDVTDWLQPDWVFEPASMTFEWRHLQPRPGVECTIEREPYASWARFARFHYLTAELNHAAQCFVLRAQGTPAAFAGVLHRPHARNRRIKGVSRLVTLPDWQGLGLAFALADRVAAAYAALDFDVHTYPAHPALIRSFDRSPMWELRHRPATFVVAKGPRSMQHTSTWKQGARPNAVFRYVGAPLDESVARELTGVASTSSKRTRTSASLPR
jgi:ABC-type ATPase involved in cell division/GNAT superfamily N-acetyltransferase